MFCDGGTGTILQAKGLRGGELPETWNLTHQKDIYDLYCGYLRAGSTIFNANTFGANLLKYPDPENLEEIITSAVTLAKKARKDCGREDDAYIAMDIGPTGKLLEPLGDLPFERAVSLFGQAAELGEKAGADLILIETMNDLYEAKAAVLGAKEHTNLPVLITTTYDHSGKLLTGAPVEAVVATLEGLRVDGLGVNCSLGPREMLPIVKRIVDASSTPVLVNPNAGLPRTENGRTVYDITADAFASCMSEIADLGIQAAGGCCGTTPEFIEKTIAAIKTKPFREQERKHHTVVTSFSQAVTIGNRPVIIGERINPTGKKKFKEALRQNNIEYILQEGLREEDQGADILDVNVGLPEIDEPAMMETIVKRLQAVTALPLQIDTTDPDALSRAMRCYNGKPMINSVNGKKESMETVFPLVHKYGGVLVGLCLDENGIPETAEGRLAVAEKIYEAADRYGVPRDDIVIDGLAMTISSDPRGTEAALGTLRGVRDRYHGHSILGVSNISFGLPARELINASFLSMAISAGLSCAIINPGNEAMMRSFYAACALLGFDENCSAFIGRYRDYKPGTTAAAPGSSSAAAPASPNGEMNLRESVIRGMTERAAHAAGEELMTRKGLDIINEDLIPALDEVGKGFENKTLFLPQLLMSADAAKAAFAVIRDSMKGAPQKIKAKVILATVKGDIHDIGKNIVKVMLENYGYDVIDLGRDVPPEVITETAVKENVPLVGLSALMTTTVVSMEETIRLLRKEKPDTKVVVGGAVMTKEYADSIGADAYAADAMETVRYADSLFDKEN